MKKKNYVNLGTYTFTMRDGTVETFELLVDPAGVIRAMIYNAMRTKNKRATAKYGSIIVRRITDESL